MTDLLRKKVLVCAVLEDQYVKSEVYKPDCKSLYKLNLKKSICVM